ncbi:MAG: hypothetical protein ACE5KZ_08675 [Candidatus Scalinduaceae bacterium]
MNGSCWSVQKTNINKPILWLPGTMRLILIMAYDRLKRICLALRDWFEDRDSYYQAVDTHSFDTKILLINKLRNQ